jgi:uncharacterized metal-binding protein
MSDEKKFIIVPCSGIGKTYGSVTRETAYDLTEDLRPADTRLVALSMLVLGDESARADVAGNQAITIDGCKLACASKMVRDSGGTVAKEYAVLDAYRRHKAFKPAGIAELNEGGIQLAHALADEIAAEIDQLKKGESTDYADYADLRQEEATSLIRETDPSQDQDITSGAILPSVKSVKSVDSSPSEVDHA